LVVSWLRDGVPFCPKTQEGLSSAPRENKVLKKEEIEWTTREIERLVATGAIKEVHREFLKEVSPVRLVPKNGHKKFRLIVNMRRLNKTLPIRHFKMEGLGTVLRLARPGDSFVTWDLKEGYFHIPVERESSRYLGVHWGGRFYAYQVLPFGCSLSPWVFTKIVHEVVNMWRRQGLLVTSYLDDFTLVAASAALAKSQRDRCIAPTLEKLGFIREETKGSWEPTTRVKVLGLLIDSIKCAVEIPEDKVAAIKVLARQVSEASEISVRTLTSAAGTVISVSRAFPFARLATRSFYDLVDAANREKWEWDHTVEVSEEAREDALFLLEAVSVFNRAPAWKPATIVEMATDASTLGWGAACLGRTAGGRWDGEAQPCHINTLEMIAVVRACLSFEDLLRGQRIKILTDNMTVKAELTRGGSKNPTRQTLVRLVWKWSVKTDVLFTIEWIPGSANDIADRESRATPFDDWTLRREVFRWLDQRWGPHSVDRLADTDNSQVQRFNSARACPNSEGVDCFTQDWSGDNNWVVPPFSLIHSLLLLIEEQGAQATLIVPRWESQPWWPLLLSLVSDLLPLSSASFLPGPSGFVEPWKNPMWVFVAVRIPGATRRRAHTSSSV